MAFSIKAFFGGDTSQLRSELGSLESEIGQKFKDMGKESDPEKSGGLGANIKGIHHAMRQFHQFIVAGGIVQALKHFFESTIDAAKKSTDQTDENTEAVKRFGHAWESISAGISAVKVSVLGFFNQVGEAFGEEILRIRGYSEEQIAVSREISEALHDQAERFKVLSEIRKIHRDIAFSEADAQGKINILLNDTAILERKLATLKSDTVEFAKTEEGISKNILDIKKLQADADKKAHDSYMKYRQEEAEIADKQRGEDEKWINEKIDLDAKLAKIAFDKMEPEKQLSAMLKERVGLLRETQNADADENEVKRAKIKLNELDNQLEETKAQIIRTQVLAAEKAVTEEKKKQLDLVHQEQAEKMGELASNSIGLQAPDQERLRGASDASLRELIRRDKDAAFKITNELRGGEGVSGSVSAKIDRANFQLEADAAQKELDARKAVRGVDYATALRNFQGNPLNFDQFYQSVNATNQIATQTNNTLLQINSRLKNLLAQ